MDNVRHRYLSSLPDLPLWVETRDLLLWEDSKIIENPTQSGFVVWSTEDGIGSVVGEPEPQAVALAARDVPELLAFEDNIERLRSLLRAFQAEPATIFTEPELLPSAPAHRCCEISLDEISVQIHLPADLLAELSDVAEDGVTIVAAFDVSHPVAFAYVASETETLWDVSIDTIRSHRRRGFALAAVVHLMNVMRKRGKSAVWGALESNPASSNLARRLGFLENTRLWVLSRKAT